MHLLAAASELIREAAETTWLNDAGDAVVDVPYRVRMICVDVAFRAFDNGKAMTQRSVGDSAGSWDRSGVDGGDMVYLTPSEERSVRRSAGLSTFTAVTLVSPYNGDDSLVDDLTGS